MESTGQRRAEGTEAPKHGVLPIEKGCRRELARFALFVLAYYLVFRFVLRIPHDFSLGFGIGLSIFGFFLVNALIIRFVPRPEVKALLRAEAGRPPQDGRVEAVYGSVVALTEPLRSPLQGAKCVAYEYHIMRPFVDTDGTPKAYKDYRGFAYAPCAVQTPSGTFSLMGLSFSSLDQFEKREPPLRETRKRAARHIEATTFRAEPMSNLSTVGDELRDLFSEARPEGRWDYCQKDAKLTDKHYFLETVLRPGKKVTAIGVYTREKQALISIETVVLQLIPGDLAAARRQLVGNAGAALLMALAMFIFSHGAFVILYLSDAFYR